MVNMKTTRMLLARTIPVIFASTNLSNPISSVNTPYLNRYCAPTNRIDEEDFIENNCICKFMSPEDKLSIEKSMNPPIYTKKETLELLTKSRTVFTRISDYIEAEFEKQESILSHLSNKTSFRLPRITDNPILKFIVQNLRVPPDEFATKYTDFSLNHILQKYKEELKGFEEFNFPADLKMKFFLAGCEAKERFKRGLLATTAEVIKFLNKRISMIIRLSSNKNPKDLFE